MGFADKAFRLLRRDAAVYALQVVTGAVIARVLGPAAMGVWIILLMIASYAESLGRVYGDAAAVQVLGYGDYQVGEVAFALIVLAVAPAVAVVAILLALQPVLSATILARAAVSPVDVALVLLYLPVRYVVLGYAYLLIAEEDVGGYNVMTVLSTLLPSALGAALLLATPAGLHALTGSLLAGAIAAAAYGMTRVHRRAPLVARWNPMLLRDLVRIGLKIYVLRALDYVYLYGAGLAVASVLPPTAVTYFRMGQDRALLLSRVSGAVGTMLYPRVARLTRLPDEARALTVLSFRRTLIALTVAGACGVILARPAVLVLYGPAFSGVIVPLMLFIPGVVAEASSGLLTQYFLGRGRMRVVIGVAAAALAIEAALLFVLLGHWGLIGAVAATAAAYVLAMAVRIGVFCRLEGVPVAGILVPRREDWSYLWRFSLDRARTLGRAPSASAA